jgi:hypothetical protein
VSTQLVNLAVVKAAAAHDALHGAWGLCTTSAAVDADIDGVVLLRVLLVCAGVASSLR